MAKMSHDIFISYAEEDKEVANAVCSFLEVQLNFQCWIAPRNILPSEDFFAAITRGINESNAVFLIFSTHSNKSKHVSNEITLSFEKGKTIIPYRIEDINPSDTLAPILSRLHWIDAIDSSDYEKLREISRLLTPKDVDNKISYSPIEQINNGPKRHKFLTLPVIFIFVMVLIYLFSQWPISSSPIRLELEVLGVGLILSDQKSLLFDQDLALQFLEVAGLRHVILPGSEAESGGTKDISVISLQSTPNLDGPTGNMIFNIELPSHSHVRIKKLDRNDTFYLGVHSETPFKPDATLSGRVEIEMPGFGRVTHNISNEILEFTPDMNDELGFEMGPVSQEDPQFNLLRIDSLFFYDIETFSQFENHLNKSTILNGELIYKELSLPNYSIQEGENLNLNNLSGVIVDLFVSPESMTLVFEGSVGTITAGLIGKERDLTPTMAQKILKKKSGP